MFFDREPRQNNISHLESCSKENKINKTNLKCSQNLKINVPKLILFWYKILKIRILWSSYIYFFFNSKFLVSNFKITKDCSKFLPFYRFKALKLSRKKKEKKTQSSQRVINLICSIMNEKKKKLAASSLIPLSFIYSNINLEQHYN